MLTQGLVIVKFHLFITNPKMCSNGIKFYTNSPELIEYADFVINLSYKVDPTDHTRLEAVLYLIEHLNRGLRSGHYGLYPLIVNHHGPPRLEYNQEKRQIVAVYEYPEDDVINELDLTDGFVVCDSRDVYKIADDICTEYTTAANLRVRWLDLFTNFFGSNPEAKKSNIHYREIGIYYNSLTGITTNKHSVGGVDVKSTCVRHTVSLLRIKHAELQEMFVHFVFYGGREFSHSVHFEGQPLSPPNLGSYGKLVTVCADGSYRPTQTLVEHCEVFFQ